MEEHVLYKIQPSIHVFALLASLALTAVQTSTSVHLAPALTVVHASKDMVQQLAVFVQKDLMAQVVILIFHSVRWTHVLMVERVMKDLEP